MSDFKGYSIFWKIDFLHLLHRDRLKQSGRKSDGYFALFFQNIGGGHWND